MGFIRLSHLNATRARADRPSPGVLTGALLSGDACACAFGDGRRSDGRTVPGGDTTMLVFTRPVREEILMADDNRILGAALCRPVERQPRQESGNRGIRLPLPRGQPPLPGQASRPAGL